MVFNFIIKISKINSHYLKKFQSSLNSFRSFQSRNKLHQVVIWIPIVLPQDVVLILLPEQLVLLALTFEVLDQIASGVGQSLEEGLQLLCGDVEIFLEPLEEFVMSFFVFLFTLFLLACDGSVSEEIGLNS